MAPMSRTALLSSLLLASCVLPGEDLDFDGWSSAEGDCADLDPSIHPSADDPIADGVDQDCDGIDPIMQEWGKTHSCLLSDSGHVSCVGENDHGQLDIPNSDLEFISIAVGNFHTCALQSSGAVTCWGDDSYHQSSPPPALFVAIEAGGNWSAGETDDGQALCWGWCLTPWQ